MIWPRSHVRYPRTVPGIIALLMYSNYSRIIPYYKEYYILYHIPVYKIGIIKISILNNKTIQLQIKILLRIRYNYNL